MKQIVFKSGHKLKITLETANILKNNILKGCVDFQVFTNRDTEELDFMINVSDISYIV